MMKRLFFVFTLALTAFGQTVDWDSSGNNLLNGTYNFREALWITDTNASNTLDEAASQYGTITFDGNGNYTANVSSWSSIGNALTTYTRSGTYAIAASGFGFIRRSAADGDYVYGAVSNGVFIASNTESGFNDLFIAAKQNTAVTTGNFNQTYAIAYTNLATASLTQIRDASFQITPTSIGGLGNIQVTGYSGGNYTAVSQTINNASLSFLNGVGTMNLGMKTTTALVSGTMQFYVAPGGQFIFGGSTNGWDMFVGVRSGGVVASTYDRLYYQAGMDVNRAQLPAGTATLESYFGGFNVISSLQKMIGHQRLQTAPNIAYEYTYSDFYDLQNGTHDDFIGFVHTVSNDGNFRIGFGEGDYLGLNVAVKAATFSGQGVYLNPTGVVNAASFTPFTTGLAPGQLITLFGSGFADTTTSDGTFPTKLAGVSVTINGRLAPLYYVSPTQINALVPYETATGVAEITVSQGTSTSNRVTAYVNKTAPGAFAIGATGLGYAAALHGDYSPITAANPAKLGEAIAVYLTGLGVTNPSVASGAAGPTAEPLARAVATIDVRVANRSAQLLYAGLAPGLRGYQINFQVPTTVPAGDQYIDIGGPDALNSQIMLPVSGARSAGVQTRYRQRPAPPQSLRTRSRSGRNWSVDWADSPSRDR
ncbi:MAG: IPT/TIG domain-containing protein [Acidobacteriota bacterium]